MDRTSKIIFIAFIIVLMIGILDALSAETIKIKGGRVVLVDTTTLVAADSVKSPYLELWGSYLEGSASFDAWIDSVRGAVNWTIYYEYGNDTLHMNVRTLLDSVETEIDTTYLHQLREVVYYQFIIYYNASAGETLDAFLGSNFIPLRSRTR